MNMSADTLFVVRKEHVKAFVEARLTHLHQHGSTVHEQDGPHVPMGR